MLCYKQRLYYLIHYFLHKTVMCFCLNIRDSSTNQCESQLLFPLCMKIQRDLRFADNRCPFMHGRLDSPTHGLTLWLPKGYSSPTSSENIQPTFDWNWNEEIQERVVWLQGWSAVSTNAISQMECYQKYQVCLYSRRLFHRIRNLHYLSAAWMWK